MIDLITDGNNMAFVHSVRDGHRSHGQLGFLHSNFYTPKPNQPLVGERPLSVHLFNRGNYFLYFVIFSEKSCIYEDTDTFVLDHG